MDLEKPKFYTSKLLTTWWDRSDHFTLVLMFTFSVASVGLQTTQDRLICIPAVDCSDLARNNPVVRKWSEANDVLDICNRSSSYVVLTTMPDQRQYDYVDSECYKNMHWFAAYYSFIFLYMAAALVFVFFFWQTRTKSASVVAHCEYLLSEIIKGDVLISTGEEGELKRQKKEFLKRLEIFKECYSHKLPEMSLDSESLTWQYRQRGLMGSVASACFAIFCIVCNNLSTGWTPCDLGGHVVFSTEHKRFQCNRSMETFFEVGLPVFIYLLLHHGLVSFYAFVWSYTGERRRPKYTIRYESGEDVEYKGDAAFVLHLISQSKGSFFYTVLENLHDPGQLQEEWEERSPLLELQQP